MMVNTDSSVLPRGKAAVLTSLVRAKTTKTECLSFWYHMGGENPGEGLNTTHKEIGNSINTVYLKKTKGFHREKNDRCWGSVICSVLVKRIFFAGSLTVYMKPAKGERQKIFSSSLNQGHVWRHGRGNIFSDLVEWQVQDGEPLHHNSEPLI